MEPEAVVHTLVSTPEGVKRKTHGYLLVYVEAAALLNTLGNSLVEEVKAKTLGELLSVVEGEARFDTLADTLADV